jgi:hypothetical protein
MTQYADDADRVIRQDKIANRGYAHDIRGIKAEAAPHETTVKDYNTQVEGFKKSAVHGVIDGKEELWQVIGWVRNFNEFDSQKVFDPVGSPGAKWQADGTDIYKGAYSGGLGYGFEGGWMWGSSPKATIRSTEGVALSSMDNQSMTPANVYASWNSQPFVAPPSATQTTAAKASNETLTGLGEQVDARTVEYDKVAGLIGAKGERVAMDVEMGQNRAGEEQAAPVAGSAFNELNVFQSIADWLK